MPYITWRRIQLQSELEVEQLQIGLRCFTEKKHEILLSLYNTEL